MSELFIDNLVKSVGEISNPDRYEEFLSHGLPEKKSEEYKFTPIKKALEKEFSDYTQHKDTTDSIQQENEIIKDSIKFVFYNGKLLNTPDLPAGIQIKSLDDLPSDSRFQPEWKDPFHLMNQSFETEGCYLIIGKGKTISLPIYIRHIVDKRDHKQVSMVRNFIHAEENSEVKVIEEFVYLGDHANFDNSEIHYILDRSARLHSYKLQLEGTGQIHLGNTFVQQSSQSYYKDVTLTLKGGMVRNNHQIFLNEEHCESHLFGLFMLNGNSHVDNHTTVDHKMANSYSNELYKGILSENSTGVFNGKIYVRPDAQKTNAFQSNKNLLLSDTATLHTKPQLEIWADDVKCSHGCTTGQLDEEAMFYLRARGLDFKQARALMLKAFVSEVIEAIEIEEIHDTLNEKVDQLLFHS